MVMTFISGIWKIILREKFLVSRHVTILNDIIYSKSKKNFDREFINTKIAGRDYQIRAIRAVMEAIEKKRRKFLLVMATGTGKTRTCIALVDALMRSGWAEKSSVFS